MVVVVKSIVTAEGMAAEITCKAANALRQRVGRYPDMAVDLPDKSLSFLFKRGVTAKRQPVTEYVDSTMP